MSEVINVMRRHINAWSPGHGNRQWESNAVTLGQLKDELREQGYDIDSKPVKISEGRTSFVFETDDTRLPSRIEHQGQITNDLIILVSPLNNKGGMIPYKEAKARVKELMNDLQKAALIKEMGNYTHFSTEKLNEVINTFDTKKPSKKPSKRDRAREVLRSVKNVAESDDCSCFKTTAVVDEQLINQGISLMLKGIDMIQAAMNINTVSNISEEALRYMAEKRGLV